MEIGLEFYEKFIAETSSQIGELERLGSPARPATPPRIMSPRESPRREPHDSPRRAPRRFGQAHLTILVRINGILQSGALFAAALRATQEWLLFGVPGVPSKKLPSQSKFAFQTVRTWLARVAAR